MRADPARQLRLLDLQALDTRLDQLVRATTAHPVLARFTDVRARHEAARDHLIRAETAQSDISRDVSKADADVQLVRDRAARDQARLDSGTGSPKDLQALQHELVSLARRQRELEDVELEVMERAERADEIVAEARAAVAALDAEMAAVTAERDSVLADVAREREQLDSPRRSLVGEVGSDLVEVYNKLRATHNGVGAAALRQRRCLGCQLELNASDIGRIRSAPPDEVIRCEECRRILIRTPESGL